MPGSIVAMTEDGIVGKVVVVIDDVLKVCACFSTEVGGVLGSGLYSCIAIDVPSVVVSTSESLNDLYNEVTPETRVQVRRANRGLVLRGKR